METLTGPEKLHAALTDIQSQRSMASSYAMNGAITALQKQDYNGAINQLRRVLAYTPDSVDAYNLMANAYANLGKTNEAITAYKNVVRMNPGSSAGHTNLGNAYLQAGNTTDAEKEFETAAKIDPTSTTAPYTLGFLYLNSDRVQEAEEQFSKVVSLNRSDAHGYYGLGLVYNKRGQYDKAIDQLKQAIQIDPELAVAHQELARAYTGTGEREQAREEVTLVTSLDAALGTLLGTEIYSPRMITSLYKENSFKTALGSGTKLSDLDPSLATPNASKDFEISFQFDSSMDPLSVQNPFNWSITRASGGTGGLYNNGVSLDPDSEVLPSPIPKMVTYDSEKMQATLTFTLTQNAAGDGIIDPSHLVFKFSGEDVNGNKMDPKADEYDGFGLMPF